MSPALPASVSEALSSLRTISVMKHRRNAAHSLRYGVSHSLRKCAALMWICLALGQVAHAESVSIAAFGDSLVHGFGLAPEEGFVQQLNGWLAKRGEQAVVINAGVSGDTTAGGLARIDWTLAADPDALIVAFGGNDLLRGMFPEESRANLDAILQRASEVGVPVLLIGQEAPSNYGEDYKRVFEAAYDELAKKHGTLFYRRFFSALEREVTREEARALYFQDDGLHPNAEGVALIVDDIGPIVISLVRRAGGALTAFEPSVEWPCSCK